MHRRTKLAYKAPGLRLGLRIRLGRMDTASLCSLSLEKHPRLYC